MRAAFPTKLGNAATLIKLMHILNLRRQICYSGVYAHGLSMSMSQTCYWEWHSRRMAKCYIRTYSTYAVLRYYLRGSICNRDDKKFHVQLQIQMRFQKNPKSTSDQNPANSGQCAFLYVVRDSAYLSWLRHQTEFFLYFQFGYRIYWCSHLM